MTRPLIYIVPGCHNPVETLAKALNADVGQLEIRHFPDTELYLRLHSPAAGRAVILYGSLHEPDAKVLPLIFLARTLRDQGASSVGLVTPYLAYMRQDKEFQPGESVTSGYFADILSRELDWLVTVDPHLHRIHDLGQIYRIPTRVVHAAEPIARWITHNVAEPLLVGPDAESLQWVSDVARRVGAPYTVLNKVRHGDQDVEVSMPDIERHRARTPVLVDDIVSTAHTMIETLGHLRHLGVPPAVCIGVHAIFAGTAYADLQAAGAARIVSTHTIEHPSSAIDLTPELARAVRELLPK